MISNNLRKAREYEEKYETVIKEEDRPAFHLSPRVGWMNDPNGFSFFDGKYHMFYQYYPYESKWGPMHWGHAVSEDMLHWKYLPAAIAPDTEADMVGCFSGSAVDMGDGRHMLLYTGVTREGFEDYRDKLLGYESGDIQIQCVAIGDGVNYTKYDTNPVIDSSMLPDGCSKLDFRDPKVWKNSDGTYNCVVGNRPADGSGQILLFTSADGIKWNFKSILIKNECRYGTMWECPDFFELDGEWVLLTSPTEMVASGLEYCSGSGTLCLIGDYDETAGKFTDRSNQSIEYGIDFYAPQTILTADGRRVMIGWMQSWGTLDIKDSSEPWFGQMTIPRELSVKNGRLYQWPAKEVESMRTGKTEYRGVSFEDILKLDGVSGRQVDMEVVVRPEDIDSYGGFEIRFAQDDNFYTSVIYDASDSVMKIDRSHSGCRGDITNQRICSIGSECLSELKLRIILDRFSAEVFINGGEKAMTITMYTEQSADDISFVASGRVNIDVVKYDLK